MKRTTPVNLVLMTGNDLADLIGGITAQNVRRDRRDLGSIRINGLAYHSEAVSDGFLFVAIEGIHTDGHRYIEQAIQRGAAAIIHSHDLPIYHNDTVYIRVPDPRSALSSLAASFYGNPSGDLRIVGVTGTDGKSTTVWIIQQLLEKLGRRSGFLSSTNIKTGKRIEKNPYRQSTPESLELQQILRTMLDEKNDFAVLEATSHGLSNKTRRLQDVLFDAAVLTNVTHEHLEFHGTPASYRNDKANLFRLLGRKKKDSFGVVNLDCPYHRLFMEATDSPVYTYAREKGSADLLAYDIRPDSRGTRFRFNLDGQAAEGYLAMPGLHNLEDLMAAVLAVCRLLDLPVESLAPYFSALTPVKGRYAEIDLGQPFKVIVDFAHTPAAFDAVLSTVKRNSRGRIITLFGSAGERDLGKRALQGAIAGRYADLVILTDEDPRGEDRLKIIEEIAAGLRDKKRGEELFIEPDRRKAIRFAIEKARPGDTILCLGKGHEESIIYADGPHPWDEIAITTQILEEAVQ